MEPLYNEHVGTCSFYPFFTLIERFPQYRGIVLESSFGPLKCVLYMEVFCDYGESTKRGSTVIVLSCLLGEFKLFTKLHKFRLHDVTLWFILVRSEGV